MKVIESRGKVMKREHTETETKKKSPPSRSLEESEQRCIADATRLAEQKLADGTASSQIIMHYLKQGTEKTRLEIEKIRYETELVRAKTEAVKSQQRSEELFAQTIAALRKYSGQDDEE